MMHESEIYHGDQFDLQQKVIHYKSELEKYKAKVRNLKRNDHLKKVDSLMTENEQLMDDITYYKQQLIEIRKDEAIKIEKKDNTISNLRTANKNLMKKISDLTTEERHITKQLDQAQEENQTLRDELSRLETNYSTLKTDKEEVMSEQNIRIQHLQEEVKTYKNKLTDKENAYEKLCQQKSKEMQQLQKQWEKEKQTLTKEFQDRIEDLSTQLTEKKTELDKEKEKNNTLREEFSRMETDYSKLKTDKEAVKKRNKKLITEKEDIYHQLLEKNSHIQRLQEEWHEEKQTLTKDFQGRIEDLSMQLKEKKTEWDKEKEKLQLTIQKAEEEKESDKAEIAHLTHFQEEMLSKIKGFKQEVDHYNESTESSEVSLTASNHLSELEQQIEKLISQVNAYSEKLESSESMIYQLEKEISEQMKDIKLLKESLSP